MSINYSPSTLSIAYRPLQYKSTQVRAKATPMVFAEVELTEQNTGEQVNFKIYPTSISDNASNPTVDNDYIFVFDIAKTTQDFFIKNTGNLPDCFVDATATGVVPAGADTIREFAVIVAYYAKDANGLISQVGSTFDFFGTRYFINATAQHTEDFKLTDYIATSSSTNLVYSATKNRSKVYTCKDNPVYLSQIADQTIAPVDIAFIAYKNGAEVGTGIIAGQSTSVNPNVYTIDLGSESLTNKTYLQISNTSATALGSVSPASMELTDSNDYDCVKFWFGAATLNGEIYDFAALNSGVSGFDPESTANEICYLSCCNDQRAIQLYWINEFGVVESYVFNSVKIKKLRTKVKTAVKGLSYDGGNLLTPHDVNQVGSFRYKTDSSEVLELKSQLLTANDLKWLQYLLESPYTFAYIDNNFVPVTISEGEYQTSEQKNRFSLELTAVLSNNRVTHRR